MATHTIASIVNHPSLPTLPAVAMEVLELSRQPDVPIKEIAQTIQNDQAITAKILRTVNSSYYALRSPCSTIARAAGYLGLNTVKSLVLGFSLVETFASENEEEASFDYQSHWRRGVYSAAGAKLIADLIPQVDADEAFISGLLQDIGALAMAHILSDGYAQIFTNGSISHEDACAAETKVFGFNHVEVGAAMGTKWKLPEALLTVIERHHKPEGCCSKLVPLLRCVILAGLAEKCMAPAGANRSDLTAFRKRAHDWFGFEQATCDGILDRMATDARDLSKLFQLDTGEHPDLSSLLHEASDLLMEHQIRQDQEKSALQIAALQDALTAAPNRKAFDQDLEATFAQATKTDGQFAILFIDADKFKSVNDNHGHQAGDAVLVELARRLQAELNGRGTAYRYGGEEFAILLSHTGLQDAIATAERVRLAIASTPFDLSDVQEVSVDELPVTISVGVSCRESGSGKVVRSAELMLRAADKAVYAAKDGGRNCVRLVRLVQSSPGSSNTAGSAPPNGLERRAKRAHPPIQRTEPLNIDEDFTVPARKLKASPGCFRILLVEDDRLQTKMYAAQVQSVPHAHIEPAESSEEAMALVKQAEGNEELKFDLILSDLGLPGLDGEEFIRHLRASHVHRTTPVLILSASSDKADIARCLIAGANAYIDKAKVCEDPRARMNQLVTFWMTFANKSWAYAA